MDQILKRSVCPLCGEPSIIVSRLFQYAHDWRMGKRGKLLKKYVVRDCGDMEVEVARCDNANCSAYWGAGDFAIEDDEFFDFKYDADGRVRRE